MSELYKTLFFITEQNSAHLSSDLITLTKALPPRNMEFYVLL